MAWPGSKQPVSGGKTMSSNDYPYVPLHRDEARFMSNPLLEYLEDEGRGLAADDGLAETAPRKDGLSLERLFDEEVGSEPGFEGIIGRSSALRMVLREIKIVAS